MDSLYAILFGAVQGLTEFLPISSSGHLVFLHSIADFETGSALAFDVALHVGTLIAVVVYFRNDIVRMLVGWVRSWKNRQDPDGRLAWMLIWATIPAAILGFLFESWFETAVRKPEIVAAVLILGGVALWWADRWAKTEQDLSSISLKTSLIIGFGQALALVPGVSRSGATIMMARLLGLSRPAAARFSFLLSIPIIAGAGLKKGLDLQGTNIDTTIFALGMVSAAIVGFWAIGWLLKLVQRHSYAGFAVYRFLAGAVALVYFLIRK